MPTAWTVSVKVGRPVNRKRAGPFASLAEAKAWAVAHPHTFPGEPVRLADMSAEFYAECRQWHDHAEADPASYEIFGKFVNALQAEASATGKKRDDILHDWMQLY